MFVFISHNVYLCKICAILCIWNSDEPAWNHPWPGSTLRMFSFYFSIDVYRCPEIMCCVLKLSKSIGSITNIHYITDFISDHMWYILKYCKPLSTKDEPQGHDWSFYLRSVTRVCMGWLNSVEFTQGTYIQYQFMMFNFIQPLFAIFFCLNTFQLFLFVCLKQFVKMWAFQFKHQSFSHNKPCFDYLSQLLLLWQPKWCQIQVIICLWLVKTSVLNTEFKYCCCYCWPTRCGELFLYQ